MQWPDLIILSVLVAFLVVVVIAIAGIVAAAG